MSKDYINQQEIMRTILLTIITLSSIHLFAQNITSDWFPQIGDELLKAYADNGEDIIIPEAGMNQVWDFSNASLDVLNTQKFIEPNALYFSEYYEGSSSANLYENSTGRSEHYYKISQDSFYKTGVANYGITGMDTLEFVRYFTPGIQIRKVPYIFGEEYENEYKFTSYKNGIFQVENNRIEVFSWKGIGTVITPEGSYENCTMIEKTLFDPDGNSLNTEYSFFRNSFSDEIANLVIYFDIDNGQNLYSFNWQADFISGTTSVAVIPLGFEIIQQDNNQFKINSEEALDLNIQMVDINGRVHQQIDAFILEGENIIDTKEFDTNGIYFMVFCDIDSGRFFTHKFTNIR